LLTGILKDESAFIFTVKYRHIAELLDSEVGGTGLLHNISGLGIATQITSKHVATIRYITYIVCVWRYLKTSFVKIDTRV
jgi:hypothetical protein